MWWECKNCVQGGNSDKSMNKHQEEFPSHQVVVMADGILEDD